MPNHEEQHKPHHQVRFEGTVTLGNVLTIIAFMSAVFTFGIQEHNRVIAAMNNVAAVTARLDKQDIVLDRLILNQEIGMKALAVTTALFEAHIKDNRATK